MPRDNGHLPSCFCGCGNGERFRAGDQNPSRGRPIRKRKKRDFPASNGTVNGQPAYVQQNDTRTVAYYGPDNVGKIVTNDGVNAAYVRDEDGRTIVNYREGHDTDPYQEYDWG